MSGKLLQSPLFEQGDSNSSHTTLVRNKSGHRSVDFYLLEILVFTCSTPQLLTLVKVMNGEKTDGG